MSRLYIVTLDVNYDREKVVKWIDENEVGYWFYSMPNSFFIKTDWTSNALSNLITKKFGDYKHFVGELAGDYWGRMPKDHWPNFL